MSVKEKRLLLVIRDGWGVCRDAPKEWDATRNVPTPHSDELLARWPHVEIAASGLDVGLPHGIMGNSEVGHQNMGAGRVVDQEIVRIDKAFSSETLADNATLMQLWKTLKDSGGKLHFMGLLSDGGVHSMTAHLYGLMQLAKAASLEKVYVHAFTDGRDTPPGSGIDYIRRCEKVCQELKIGKIATVIGRYWAMDRDQRWDRVEMAYRCLIGKNARHARSAVEAVDHYYKNPQNISQQGDEFIIPTQIVDKQGNFSGSINAGDGVIFFNFRGDRPREISKAFLREDFNEFPRERISPLHYVTMTEYEKGLCDKILFPKPPPMKNILGEYISSLGLRQFRTAETEKYAHVTFFFNDYREAPFAGEDRQLIPSPRDITTYDQRPQMSAVAVCDAVLMAMDTRKYDLIVVNFANADMVGHTGNFEAAKLAVKTVDDCLGRLMRRADELSMVMLIGADHGNVEIMWDEIHNIPHTQHTTNAVHVILYGCGCENLQLRSGGRLADIAPTILQLMGLKKPAEMSGESLIFVKSMDVE
ncbi:MAG: 2,3-bisphosphoglycerate-independent phosphoglycerate mutase [Puniceicoccales bacterium]|jgi:2,3-bisphosphoglycerate-independent phosphoglycerate mutase|nr:2,3-bisphosphoglycerate-independent phosphoglycerate mutase [Puniceicoccales bacterium]